MRGEINNPAICSISKSSRPIDRWVRAMKVARENERELLQVVADVYLGFTCLWHYIFGFCLLLMLLFQLPSSALEFSGQVVGVSDGDTITILRDGSPIKIRLARIDCPEKKQAFGQAAKRFTSTECFGQMVTINEHGHDRYGRTIGDVLLPTGITLNEELVQQGLAWQYQKYSHDPTLAREEQQARNDHLGLWNQPNPAPPWVYRHQSHKATDDGGGR